MANRRDGWIAGLSVGVVVGGLAGTSLASGMCCRGATCNMTITQSHCLPYGLAGAKYMAIADPCGVGVPGESSCCVADYDKNSWVSMNDLFAFINDWFMESPMADVGGDGESGSVDIADVFAYVTVFLGSCS
ncbi:MAG TPA: GC-type dockerin domain-anchored protein [Phycisphaerales bacterium]|jgi:hypothetical protein|nr:GC-type dockerin domain-anchored protein [Phycisphaerales bacterium]